MDNPWNIKSIYELQFFNCPTCEFKNQFKQEFVNHAYASHPDSLDFLINIPNNSFDDIICPWDVKEIKKEESNSNEVNLEIDPLQINDFEDSSEEFVSKVNTEEHCMEENQQKDVKKVHNRISKSQNRNSKECLTCGKVFGESNLKRHIETVHKGLKNYKCDLCAKSFGTAQYLTIHTRDHP